MPNQPVRQLQIPNILNKDITDDIQFTENTNVSFEYTFDQQLIELLYLEISGNLPATLRYIDMFKSPLNLIKSTLESRIIDSIENSSFILENNSITIDGLVVRIDCNLKIIPKY